MSSLDWQEARRIGHPAHFQKARKVFPPYGKVSAAAESAQWFEFDVPQDNLLHSILITVGEDTTSSPTTRGTLADDITDIEVTLNGYLVFKQLKGSMSKALAVQKWGDILGTGYYRIDFSDPRIPESKPLPTFLPEIESIKLRIKDNQATALNYHHIIPHYIEEYIPFENRKEWLTTPLLAETYGYKWSGGTRTGWRNDPYEHTKDHKVYGFLYLLTDNETAEDPATDGYDFFKIEGLSPAGRDLIIDEASLITQKELNETQYQAALPTGYVAVDFPIPLDCSLYERLYTWFSINTAAATEAQVWVCERYLIK